MSVRVPVTVGSTMALTEVSAGKTQLNFTGILKASLPKDSLKSRSQSMSTVWIIIVCGSGQLRGFNPIHNVHKL